MLDNKTFKKYIKKFYESMPKKSSHRYKSWEYCYKFFYDNRKKLVDKHPETIDLAALHLAFYLASWGMYRGSSFLLQMDYTVHKKAVEIISYYFDLVDIEINNWQEDHTAKLFKLNKRLNDYYVSQKSDLVTEIDDIIKTDEKNISDTLITKILLGTLGITPAYDRYFKKGLKLYNNIYTSNKIPASFTDTSFNKLIDFCKKHSEFINNQELKLKTDTTKQYPFMKKIDMFFWNLGRPWAIRNKENNWQLKNSNKTVDIDNQYVNYLSDDNKLDCFEKYIKNSC